MYGRVKLIKYRNKKLRYILCEGRLFEELTYTKSSAGQPNKSLHAKQGLLHKFLFRISLDRDNSLILHKDKEERIFLEDQSLLV